MKKYSTKEMEQNRDILGLKNFFKFFQYFSLFLFSIFFYFSFEKNYQVVANKVYKFSNKIFKVIEIYFNYFLRE